MPVVEWIDDLERFEAIAPEWDRLAATADSPFALHCWHRAWWDAFAGSQTLRVVALWEGERLTAAMPLCAAGHELRWMANWHTPVAEAIYADRDALLALVDEAMGPSGPVAMRPLADGSPTLEAAVDGARRARRLVMVESDQVSPFVSIEGDWDSYRAAMKRRWSSADRKARKMEREHDARFSIVEPPRDLERELEHGFEVEASGWKGRAGTAIVSSPETARFYTQVARSFERAGELVLSQIALDGQCVAFDLCLLRNRRLYLLKTGFDEAFGTLSPGLVLRYLVVRRCFELGLETHELLGDEAEWKRRFSTGERSYRSVRAMPRTPSGALRYGYRRYARARLRSVKAAVDARRGR